MRLLLFALLFSAAPLWSDSLISEVIFFGPNVYQTGCLSVSVSLSPVSCSATYAPSGNYGSGSDQFHWIDSKTFEFKGTIDMSTPALSPIRTVVGYYLNL